VGVKVSVAIITYNHENFIAQAIESILMQVVNFDYEIIIGEDCSTDETRNIVIEYQNRFPHRIKLLLHDKNVGLMRNFIQTIETCRGQYVALCEGDDYWTSPHKLQKQVDFLESHPEYVMCFHNAIVVCEDGSEEPRLYCPADQKIIPTLEDLFQGNFIPTCSVMFCRGLFSGFPNWCYSLRMGDWPLHIFNAQHGNIRYLNEIMGVYRIHPGGAWSAMPYIQQYKEIIMMLGYVHTYLGFQYKKQIKTAKSVRYYMLAETYAHSGDAANATLYLMKSMIECPFNSRIPVNRIRRMLRLYTPVERIKRMLRLHTPALYCFAKTLKNSIRHYPKWLIY
jgi:glycosyltransferase involved in cell wall biosynthesis